MLRYEQYHRTYRSFFIDYVWRPQIDEKCLDQRRSRGERAMSASVHVEIVLKSDFGFKTVFFFLFL